MPARGGVAVLRLELQKKARACHGWDGRVSERCAQARGKRLLSRIIERMLISKEQHLVAHQGSSDRIDDGILEISREDEAADFRADPTRDGNGLQLCLGSGGHDIDAPVREDSRQATW